MEKILLLNNGDIVSIIPVIHGGSSKKLIFEIEKKQIQILRNSWSKEQLILNSLMI